MAAEASSTVANLLASGRGLAGTLSFNVSDYLNVTSGGDALRAALASYNITNFDAWRNLAWFGPLGAALNETTPAPEGTSRVLLMAGTSIVLVRELYVRWRVRALLRRWSGRRARDAHKAL